MDNPSFPEQMGYGAWLERPEHRGIYHDAEAEKAIFGEEGLTFESLLDALNPLHHIPIVNSIYRELTGDTIAPGPSFLGGLLFGGVLGAVGSVATTAFESLTGDTLAGHTMTAFGSDRTDRKAAGTAQAEVSIGEITVLGQGSQPSAEGRAPEAAPQSASTAAAEPYPSEASPSQEVAAQAFTATGAGNDMFRARPREGQSPAAAGQAATPQAVPGAPPAAEPAASADRLQALSNARAEDMPELPADLDARLRHAQKALAASGLVPAGDEELHSRLGAVLGTGEDGLEAPAQAAAAPAGRDKDAVPPPPTRSAEDGAAAMADTGPDGRSGQGPTMPEPAQAQAQAQVEVQEQVQPQAMAAAGGERRFMPLDGGGRTRRWYGLGTAEIVPAAATQTPQMAAQALANQVYRQQAEALQQGGAARVDLTY